MAAATNTRKRKQARAGGGPAAVAVAEPKPGSLEAAIGRQVREFRQRLQLTVVDLGKLAGVSRGMVSKIENGMTSPSLATLNALAQALNVPVTSLFRKYEEQRDATFVKADQGLVIERRGTRAGHQYQLLGHTVGKTISVEPYLITLSEESEIFPLFQHAGVEFVYILEGNVSYRHGGRVYQMGPGDSLFFDSDAPHGPEELLKLPIRFLSVIVQPHEEG